MSVYQRNAQIRIYKYLFNALMMEAVSTSEKLVNVYQTTRHNNPEDSHLHSRRCENLKYTHYKYYASKDLNFATTQPK
jgi:hypothetical protein